MGIREKLNENPAITTGATIGIILIALIFIGYQLFSNDTVQVQTKAFYTTDDSSPEAALAALFEDDVNKVPPFSKDGKDAYRAFVFTCDGGKTKFVSYLQRYTKEAKTKIEAAQNSPDPSNPSNPGMMEMVHMTGVEVRKPGPGAWIRQDDYVKSSVITSIKCPDGTMETIDAVLPD